MMASLVFPLKIASVTKMFGDLSKHWSSRPQLLPLNSSDKCVGELRITLGLANSRNRARDFFSVPWVYRFSVRS
jgi:hypothetical protein